MMASDQRQRIIKKKTGLYVIGIGIVILTVGYVLLGKGSMTAAPVLIIGAFLIMAIGILIGWD